MRLVGLMKILWFTCMSFPDFRAVDILLSDLICLFTFKPHYDYCGTASPIIITTLPPPTTVEQCSRNQRLGAKGTPRLCLNVWVKSAINHPNRPNSANSATWVFFRKGEKLCNNKRKPVKTSNGIEGGRSCSSLYLYHQ